MCWHICLFPPKIFPCDTVPTHKFKSINFFFIPFRRALQRLSSSAEAFYVLRATMLQSHSVVCICQYLLGIGDRHLSNFMVNLKTGHMIGIDFGHAFGSATQVMVDKKVLLLSSTQISFQIIAKKRWGNY